MDPTTEYETASSMGLWKGKRSRESQKEVETGLWMVQKIVGLRKDMSWGRKLKVNTKETSMES